MIFYREEIDGLRAIGVLSVIFYHGGLKRYIPGGYVGVDIFFVISGYLITSIIKHQYEENNQFSLINFYERRCRRILPALVFILFISSIFAYYYMLPNELKDFGESLISITFFSSNIYFWYKDKNYFSDLTELNPLVHTWSLAVEEQFYLIYPLLCYLLMKKKSYFISLLIFISLFSLFICQWGENLKIKSLNQFQMFSQPEYASFYLSIGRLWELLIGVFVGLYMKSDHKTKYILDFYRLMTIVFS